MKPHSHIEIPEPDNYDSKEVYAFFGLASYFAQVLERGLIIMTVAFRFKALDISRSEFDAFYIEQNKKTLGQLLNKARESISIPKDIDTLLGEALLKRKWLMHHYFADRSAQFNTEIGRIQMISELQLIIRIFIEADHATEPIYMPILEEFGVTEELVEKLIKDLINEHSSNEIANRR